MTRGIKMYGMGMQGSKGDQTKEKPNIFDVVGGLKWEGWEELRGIDKKFAQKMFIVYASKLLVDEGHGKWLENPRKPGPSYYSECK